MSDEPHLTAVIDRGYNRHVIVRARLVVTMDGPPIENGAVAISGSRIVDVGTFQEISARTSEEILDLGEQALLPGLINAHCHLDYTCLRGRIPRQDSFAGWIRAINAEKAKLGPEAYVTSITAGFLEARRFGTTTIANLTAFPELISQIRPLIRTWWFPELINVRTPELVNVILDRAIKVLKEVEHCGLAPHAPFTASEKLYRECQGRAGQNFLRLTTHLAESREEMSMFRDASGPLYEFLKQLGRPMTDCGNQTPLARFFQYVDEEEPWLLVHVNELVNADLDLLRRAKPNFRIVHCPRSHNYFRHSPFQFQNLRKLGFNICLGTDSLASNDDLSLFAEMRAFQREFTDVHAQEILEMATVKPALALGRDDLLGRIRPNAAADLIAIPCPKKEETFEGIIAHDGSVDWVMADGIIQ